MSARKEQRTVKTVALFGALCDSALCDSALCDSALADTLDIAREEPARRAEGSN